MLRRNAGGPGESQSRPVSKSAAKRDRTEHLVSLAGLSIWGKPELEPEEARIRNARGGDRRAFDGLVDAYDGELRRFLQRRVAKAEVDDLVQDSWLAAWGSIRSFDGRCRFRTWLYGIALFKVRDHYRSRGRNIVEVSPDHLDHRLR
jgi:hypothetical protein